MDTTDSAGFPKRSFGDRIIVNGRNAVVIENIGLIVLCECADGLVVQYADKTTEEITNDTFVTW